MLFNTHPYTIPKASMQPTANKKRQPWSKADDELLRRLYPTKTRRVLAVMLGRTVPGVQNRIHNLGLSKTCNSGRFYKGHKAWNKGKRGVNMGGKSTQYKKGNLPANTKHVGSISMRRDNSGRIYLHYKIAEHKWVLYQRYIWEQANGPIPAGGIIRFRDGDTLNFSLGNLELITRSQNAQLNYNRNKAGESMRKLYKQEYIRVAHLGLQPKTRLPKITKLAKSLKPTATLQHSNTAKQ